MLLGRVTSVSSRSYCGGQCNRRELVVDDRQYSERASGGVATGRGRFFECRGRSCPFREEWCAGD